MNNEIKEILDYIKIIANINEEHLETELTHKDCALLLDYITNLQEKVDKYENPDDLTLFYMWLDEKAKDKITNLQEERDFYKYTDSMNLESNIELRYRIDKATKILNEGLKELDERGRNEVYIEEYLENALDELNGSDKDE